MAATKGSVSSRKRSVGIEDVGARVEVRRHPGARRLTLRVSRTRRAVIVTLPLQCDLDEAGTFLSRHIDWVRERLDSLPELVPFAHGMMMPLRGEPHAIIFTGKQRSRVVDVTNVCGRAGEIRVPGDESTAAKRLRHWLLDEAKRDLDVRVSVHAKTLDVRPKRIAVRDQASRWGSCSTTRVLSFSWRLLLAPPRILDYVAAHEVAHLREMNHGPRFWALVKRSVPDYEASKRWLQVYGLDLHRYGVSGGADD